MREQIRSWIDSIFAPMHAFLDMAIEQLQQAQAVTAQGLNFGQYFSVFGDLPTAWQMVLNSLLISMGLIGGLFILRSILRVYFAKKDAVKWW